MEIRVERLREALNLLKPAVPRKATLPVTRNVLLKEGKAMATDLEVRVSLELPEVTEACLIPHKTVLEVLKYVPGDETLGIEAKRKTLRLSWQGGEATYDVNQPDDYPPEPEVQVVSRGNLDGGSLIKALTASVDYCATDDKRPVLTGVHLFLGERIAVAAADAFRMTYQELPLSFPAQETAIIPAHAVKVLDHLWDKASPPPPVKGSLIEQITAKRQLNLGLGAGRLKLSFGRVTLITQLISGTPPSYLQLLPKEEEVVSQAYVHAPEFERAVRRVQDVVDKDGIVRLSWNQTALTVVARNEDKGKVEAEVPLVGEATPGRVALNVSYLLDYLKGKQGVLSIGVKNEQSPVLFHHGNSPLVMIMPMFVQW